MVSELKEPLEIVILTDENKKMEIILYFLLLYNNTVCLKKKLKFEIQ